MTATTPEAQARKIATNAAWYQANKEKRAAQHKAWVNTPEGRERQRLSNLKTRSALRSRALEHMGGVCVRCGFSDPRALQIDHIEGMGWVEHREIGTLAIARRVLAGEPGYQLLCANCNWIKRAENGETRGIGAREGTRTPTA